MPRGNVAHASPLQPIRAKPLPTGPKKRHNGVVMDHVTIRSARPEDARSIAKVDVETWRATYAGVLSTPYLVGLSERRRELGWRNVILREPRDVRVAVGEDGTLLGFGSCGPSHSDRRFAGEVFTLYVDPDWQNQGIGRRLLFALFRRLVAVGRSSVIIWVLRDNPSRSKPLPMVGATCPVLSPQPPARTASPNLETGAQPAGPGTAPVIRLITGRIFCVMSAAVSGPTWR